MYEVSQESLDKICRHWEKKVGIDGFKMMAKKAMDRDCDKAIWHPDPDGREDEDGVPLGHYEYIGNRGIKIVYLFAFKYKASNGKEYGLGVKFFKPIAMKCNLLKLIEKFDKIYKELNDLHVS